MPLQGPGEAKAQQELDAPAQRLPITIVWETGDAQDPEPRLVMVETEPDQPPEDDIEVLESNSR